MTFQHIRTILKDSGVRHFAFRVEQNYSRASGHTCLANTSSGTCLIDEVNITVPDILDITRVHVLKLTLENDYEHEPSWVHAYVESYEELHDLVSEATQAYATYAKELAQQENTMRISILKFLIAKRMLRKSKA